MWIELKDESTVRGRGSTLSLKRPEEIFWPYFHRSNSHLSSQSIFQVKFDNDTRKSLHYETKNYLVNLLRVSANIFYISFNNPRINLRQNTTTVKRLEIFSAMRMSDPASLGFRGLDLSLNPPKPLPVLRSHAAIPRFTSFPSPAVAVHIARRRFIENHISVHENTAFPQPL